MPARKDWESEIIAHLAPFPSVRVLWDKTEKPLTRRTSIIWTCEDHPGEIYSSRMDDLLKPKSYCCNVGYNASAKEFGYAVTKKRIEDRGNHYNATWILLTPESSYEGKHKPVRCLCKTHNYEFSISPQILKQQVACPCIDCKVIAAEKNIGTPAGIKLNNQNIAALVRWRARNKDNQCAIHRCLVPPEFLQTHHILGAEHFPSHMLDDGNAITLLRSVHLTYHYGFLPNIKPETVSTNKHKFVKSNITPSTFVLFLNAFAEELRYLELYRRPYETVNWSQLPLVEYHNAVLRRKPMHPSDTDPYRQSCILISSRVYDTIFNWRSRMSYFDSIGYTFTPEAKKIIRIY